MARKSDSPSILYTHIQFSTLYTHSTYSTTPPIHAYIVCGNIDHGIDSKRDP